MNFSRKMDYQYNDHARIRSKFLKFITKIMITNDWSIIHYQDNHNEAFLGRVITGNDHSAHDHIHYLQRLLCRSKSESTHGILSPFKGRMDLSTKLVEP